MVDPWVDFKVLTNWGKRKTITKTFFIGFATSTEVLQKDESFRINHKLQVKIRLE